MVDMYPKVSPPKWSRCRCCHLYEATIDMRIMRPGVLGEFCYDCWHKYKCMQGNRCLKISPRC